MSCIYISFTDMCCFLLITLWVYATVSRVMDIVENERVKYQPPVYELKAVLFDPILCPTNLTSEINV